MIGMIIMISMLSMLSVISMLSMLSVISMLSMLSVISMIILISRYALILVLFLFIFNLSRRDLHNYILRFYIHTPFWGLLLKYNVIRKL